MVEIYALEKMEGYIMEYQKIPQKINDIVGDNVKKLAEIFPSAVKDGEVDFEALRQELGEFIEVGAEKYELTWAGKQNAKKIAQEDIVGKTLKFIPEDSKDADITENLYIEGDNLEVLKLLRQNYYSAVKMIYIDPPYNTGNDFVYNDSFGMSKEDSDIAEGTIDEIGKRFTINKNSQNRFHANWLNMMYSRLRVCKDLLSDDGVIFISIDDYEANNLKYVCDEIFGSQNMVGTVVWERAFAPKNDAKFFSTSHDYILVYAKQIEKFQIGKLPRTNEANNRYKNPDNDSRGPWTSGDLSVKTYSKNTDYPITTPSGRVVNPPNGACWRISKEKFEELLADNRIYFGADGNNVPRLKRFLSEIQDGMTPTTLWRFQDVGHNQEGRQELKKMFADKGYFDGPKPVRLLKRILQIANVDNESIVLDFFSGSASMAQAVMHYNMQHKLNCHFLMVQLPEKIGTTMEAYNDGYKTICDIGEERIRLAGEKIKQENPDADIDIGFKVFRVADSNIKWNAGIDLGQLDISQIETTPDLIDFMPNAKDVDIVYELMLRQKDVPLSLKVERIFGGGGYQRTFLYADSYLVCLETEITEKLINKLAGIDPLPIKFIFRDSAFQDDIALKDETFRRLKALIEKNNGMSKMAYTVEFI